MAVTVKYVIKLFVIALISITLGVLTDILFDYISQKKIIKSELSVALFELVFSIIIVLIAIPLINRFEKSSDQIITLDAMFVTFYFAVLINLGLRIKDYFHKSIKKYTGIDISEDIDADKPKEITKDKDKNDDVGDDDLSM